MSESIERRFQPRPPGKNNESGHGEPVDKVRNPEAQISPQQRLFLAACNERLDELVRLGMLPEPLAEERKRSAALVEEGFSDNPEDDGLQFAEIGVENIGVFRRSLGQLEQYVDQHINPYLENTRALVARLEDSEQHDTAAALQEKLQTVQEGLQALQNTIDKTKELEIPFQDLHRRIMEIQKALGDAHQ